MTNFGHTARRAADWHARAFPGDDFAACGLALGEEAAELVEAVEALAGAASLTRAVGRVQRTILKEGHGADDRRADVDWVAERRKEYGDVLVVLATMAAADGVDLEDAFAERLDFVIDRFPGPVRS